MLSLNDLARVSQPRKREGGSNPKDEGTTSSLSTSQSSCWWARRHLKFLFCPSASAVLFPLFLCEFVPFKLEQKLQNCATFVAFVRSFALLCFYCTIFAETISTFRQNSDAYKITEKMFFLPKIFLLECRGGQFRERALPPVSLDWNTFESDRGPIKGH